MTYPDVTTKSKQALIDAFNQLVLANPYREFHIADIISRADVSRSTFYEHFRNKDDILRYCMTHVLTPLADAGFPGGDAECIKMVLDHFREFEKRARVYLNGPVCDLVEELLSEMIVDNLALHERVIEWPVPSNLIGQQISASTIALVRGWINTPEAKVDPQKLAMQIVSSATALINARSDAEK